MAAPVAAFSGTPTSGTAPLTVQFTDESAGLVTSRSWDFNNDGTIDSTAQNPAFVYDTDGIYTVNLTVAGPGGADSSIRENYITVSPAPVDEWSLILTGRSTEPVPRTGFASLADPNRLTYTDASGTWSGIALWRLLARVDDSNPATFNDTEADLGYNVTVLAGDGYSRTFSGAMLKRNDTWIIADTLNGEQLPMYDPSNPSKRWWPVRLVGNGLTSGQKVANITTITLSDFYVPPLAAPVAAFNGIPTSGTAPLTVQFTDESAGMVTSRSWDFNNDGTIDSTAQNPAFVYDTDGIYAVNLTVTGPGGADSSIRENYISVSSAPSVEIIYDGAVTLTRGETFTVPAYNNVSGIYTVNRTTPLGALDKVASLQGFTYNVTDKRWAYDEVLLLDDVAQYIRKPGYWYAYVNGVYRDGYGNHANGLNVMELATNDQVDLYYAQGVTSPADMSEVIAKANATVKMEVSVEEPGPSVDTLYDGTVTLTPGETFPVQAYNNVSGIYTVNRTTPLGALDKIATQEGFTYNVTDKRWAYDEVLLLDDVAQYIRKPGYWYAYVNGVYRDGYGNHANGLNVMELATNDQVNFYYAQGVTSPSDMNEVISKANATVKIRVTISGSEPVSDWTLSLSGASDSTVSKTFFEQGLACPSSGHQIFWTDGNGDVWGGVPLWVLVALVDDDPDAGPDHFNFNDSIAAQGYSVKVVGGDGWDTVLSSTEIARNDTFIVANTVNGKTLPANLTSGKLSWPLHLKGDGAFGGRQVGNITRIELTGLPEAPEEWTLTLEGDVTDTITQNYFVSAIACHHNVTWIDGNGDKWEGVPLWDLAGAVDDIETSGHYTFNDTRAETGYTIRVFAVDGFNATFASADVAHNDGYFLAHKKNDAVLIGTDAPLKLVGPATTSGRQRVGNVTKISLEGLPSYPAGDWQLRLAGRISDTIPQSEFEYWAGCHNATYTDTNGNVYTGIPIWRLMGWVDDQIPHGPSGFNDAAALAGYKVIVKAATGTPRSSPASRSARRMTLSWPTP